MNKPLALGTAAAVTIGSLYLICLGAVLLAPDGSIAFFNSWFHGIDLSAIRRQSAMSVTEIGIGLASAVAVSFCFGWLFGAVYCRLVGADSRS